MSKQQNGFKKNLYIHLEDNPAINGLDNFKKNLEKDFYSQAQVRSCSCNPNGGNLVIEMECPLVLGELLFHLNKGNWGNVEEADDQNANNSLAHRVGQLQLENEIAIEIEELSIVLKNATLVIKKIFPNSIERELNEILAAISEHYVHFTRGEKESNYEIYIPVLDENATRIQPEEAVSEPVELRRAYLRYWGLYFDSEEDAVIYDLSQRSFISGDLHMLNH